MAFSPTPPAPGWGCPNDSRLSGASACESLTTNNTATLSFNGTGVSWIGFKATFIGGLADVYVDGTLVATNVDSYAPSGQDQPQAVMYTASGLARGPHTMMIKVKGMTAHSDGSNWVLVDAFDVSP